MKVYVVGDVGSYDDINWIPGAVSVKKMQDADLVFFTGGADVNPDLYGEPRGAYTYINENRDIREVKEFLKAYDLGLPCFGTCRGLQLLHVMAGGKLIQHQEDPYPVHNITTKEGKELLVTSCHHQAAYLPSLSEDEYELIGWTEGMSKFHLDGEDKEMGGEFYKEAEIVYYPKIKSLGVQGHLEWMTNDYTFKESIEYSIGLLEEYLELKPYNLYETLNKF